MIQDTASSATFCALLAARERATDGAAGRDGIANCPTLVAYTSEHSHSSIEKACTMSGIGRSNLRMVPSDPETFAMDPDALAALMKEDAELGTHAHVDKRASDKILVDGIGLPPTGLKSPGHDFTAGTPMTPSHFFGGADSPQAASPTPKTRKLSAFFGM